MKFLKTIWEAWKKFAHKLGKIQTAVLLTVIYFVVIPLFSLLRLRDPLRKRLGSKSYWENFKTGPMDLENFRRMF